MTKIAWFFIILFFVAGATGFWYWQTNTYSKEMVKVEIIAPSEVQSGEVMEYNVKIKHNGDVRLESPELIFQAPEQSLSEDGNKKRITKKIETIYPGEERTYTFKTRLFYRGGETPKAEAILSYKPKNLKAVYESKTSFTTEIKYTPLTFEFDLPSGVENNGETIFYLNYYSNVDYLLEGLRVKVNYPEGFEFISAEPEALDKTEWSLPSLYKASGGRIEIRGKIKGNEGDANPFSAELGLFKDGDFWTLKETSQSLKIVAPSLYMSFLINNKPSYRATEDEMLHYEIFFKNIGKKPVQKKFAFVTLEGEFFDLSSLRTHEGEFGRGDNTIIWDWKEVPGLRFLDVGEEGKVEFWIKTKKVEDNHSVTEPKLLSRVNLAGVEKVFETKINSEVALSQKAYFQQEFFQNEGELPPKAGEETEFVVLWQIKNKWNKLENVKVKANLPENVSPTGKIFPEEAKFSFDSDAKTAMWTIDEIEPWKGYKNEPLTMAFQVELEPKESQSGDYAELIKKVFIFAEDGWTGDILEEEAPPVNTSLPDDETISKEDGKVVD